MPIEVDTVPFDEVLPAQVDVVVIGGGIVGASTALFLAERGVSTLLCEKGLVAAEQSSRNWGWCRAMGRDPHELPLMMHSLELWRGMNGCVNAETGFRQTGTLYLCPDAAALAGAPVLASWGGMIDTTPDMLPVISEVDAMPGLVVSTGYSGHGFGIGPGAGSLTADLAMGRAPVVDPRPFRFSRFADEGAARAKAA